MSVLDAPSSLGLRPPAPGVVPGCYELAGALRDCGLLRRVDAMDAGCVTPPRYDRHEWRPGDGVANAVGTDRLAHDLTGTVVAAFEQARPAAAAAGTR